MSRSLGVILASLLAGGCAPSEVTEGVGFDGSGDVIQGEFAITSDLSVEEQDQLGLVQLDWDDHLGWGLYLAEDGVSSSALDRAISGGRGEGVEPNRPVRAASVNDPLRSYQWDMTAMDVEGAWAYGTGRGVRVAVIDTGVGRNGEDKPKNLMAGYDFVSGDNDSTDENGHGSHVAGTIAQATNNGKGCIGVAPDAEILPLRVLDAQGSGDAYTIAKAIVYAADQGAKVINMSLGSAQSTGTEKDAVAYAIGKGVVIVAASGNESATSVGYPASYDGVIAVGATRYDGQVAAYSNGGTALDVVAPGGDMGVDQNHDGYGDGIVQEVVLRTSHDYELYEGTSMASPHVAGLAALLISAGARPADVPGLITSTAKDIGPAGFDVRAGYGSIQPVAALRKIGQATTAPPAAPPSTTDVTPPTISGVWASQSGTSLTIGWNTSEAATSHVTFSSYGTFGDDNLVTTHSLRFTVSSTGTYTFTVVSADAAHNSASNGPWSTR